MKKHSFLSLIASIALCSVCACTENSEGTSSNTTTIADIETGFQNPDSMKIGVYWYWISDNISKEGVERDLEAMKKVGINRAFIGNIGINEEGVPYGKVKLFTPEWWDIMHAALKKASELDIEIGIFNCPGWSQSGGPWVKPEQSMRYLDAISMTVKGPKKGGLKLPDLAKDAMTDVKIIAYPKPAPSINNDYNYYQTNKTKKNGEKLTVEIPNDGKTPFRTLNITVKEPTRIITDAEIFAEENGSFRSLKKFHIDRSNPALNVGFIKYPAVVISIPETNANKLKIEFAEAGEGEIGITLLKEASVERFPEKTLAKMFQTPLPMWDDYLWEKQPEIPDSLCVNPDKVIDLTDKFKDGILNWDVPEGNWTIMRTAMRPTGVVNAPASPEGEGFETDKMSKKHIAAHFDAFLGEILRRIPAEDRKTFKVVVEDSYETGGLNWTDDMIDVFRSTYGYSPVPYIPVLYGTVVGNEDISDRFLWDLRRLIADRVAYDYVGGLREISNKNGLTTWLENYGHWGFPSEFLKYGGQSDEISGEFWSEGSLGDIENRAASSCAHTYGKRKVWAESCTSGGPVFSRYPNIMKQRLDRFFTEGINSTLLHVFIEQPYEDRNPGMAAWFGNEFNRKNTWFSQMDVFTKYLKRCNFMLQQGLYVADVAYFIGEDAPKMTGVCTPKLQKGYSFDYINAEVLLTRATVKNGRLTLPDGMSYKLLVLPQLETMRPELLAKIKNLVNDGLAILGPAPQRSPSLTNYPQADKDVTNMAKELWGDGSEKICTVGQGKVFADGLSIEDVFANIGVTPDMTVKDAPDAPVLFIHRTTTDGEIYFVSNQSDQPITINAQFRVNGKVPELWNPLTDEIRTLPEFSVSDKKTTVPLQLQGFESFFIVFNKNGKPSNSGEKNFPEKQLLLTVSSPWQVTFEADKRGPEGVMTMNSLEDWTKSTDNNLRYYSGTAFYKTTVSLNEIPAKQIYIDLGKVMVMAKVKINGEYAGGVWTSPYRLNITKLIRQGDNTIEVEVANNWMNRLIGDKNLPEKERKTWTNVNPWKADSPLQSSGLLGPVEIQAY